MTVFAVELVAGVRVVKTLSPLSSSPSCAVLAAAIKESELVGCKVVEDEAVNVLEIVVTGFR